MAVTSPQTFGKDYILTKLVAYFNSQPASARTIKSNDLPLYNIKVIEDGDGQPTIIVGDQSGTYPSAQFLGEATYVWIGPRDVVATANTTSFFEVSKYVNVQPTTSPGGNPLSFIVTEATYIGGELSAGEVFPSLPQGGEYKYYLNIVATESQGWGGGVLGLLIDNTWYDITLIGSGSHELLFAANSGVNIKLYYDDPNNFDSAQVILRQYEAEDTPTGPSSIVVWPEGGTAPEYMIPNSIVVAFTAPYVPVLVDMHLTTNVNIISQPGIEWFGVALATNADLTRIAIRDGQSSGTSWLYNNLNPAGEPDLSFAGSVYGGYRYYQNFSASGEYFAPPSGSFAAPVRRWDGSGWFEENAPFVGGNVAVTDIQVSQTGVPTLIATDSSNNRIKIFERDVGGTWNEAYSLNSPGGVGGFGRALAFNADANAFVASDHDGGIHLYTLDGDNWSTGTKTHTVLTNLLNTGGATASISGFAFNTGNDLAVTYMYTDGEDNYKLCIWESVTTDGASSVVAFEMENNEHTFAGLTSCDAAYTSGGVAAKGFMAATHISSTNVGLWISPDAQNTDTNAWPKPVSSPEHLVMFKLPDDVLVQGYNSGVFKCLAPLYVSRTEIRCLVGRADAASVDYQGFTK